MWHDDQFLCVGYSCDLIIDGFYYLQDGTGTTTEYLAQIKAATVTRCHITTDHCMDVRHSPYHLHLSHNSILSSLILFFHNIAKKYLRAQQLP